MKFIKIIINILILLILIISCSKEDNGILNINFDDWEHNLMYQIENTDYYDQLLIYGIEESARGKLADNEFLQGFGLLLLRELYGKFDPDYRIAIERGDNIIIIYYEKPDHTRKGIRRTIVFEKKTGRIIAIEPEILLN